jgi:hypothetical protein
LQQERVLGLGPGCAWCTEMADQVAWLCWRRLWSHVPPASRLARTTLRRPAGFALCRPWQAAVHAAGGLSRASMVLAVAWGSGQGVLDASWMAPREEDALRRWEPGEDGSRLSREEKPECIVADALKLLPALA